MSNKRFNGLTSDDMKFGNIFKRNKPKSKNLEELKQARKEFGIPTPKDLATFVVEPDALKRPLEEIKGIGKVTANRMRDVGIPDANYLAECSIEHCDLNGHRYFAKLGWTKVKFMKFVELAQGLFYVPV